MSTKKPPGRERVKKLADQIEAKLSTEMVNEAVQVRPSFKKLTYKEQRFILEYVKGTHNSLIEVTKNAGYVDPTTGYALMKKDYIIAEIDRIMLAREAVSIITREYVLSEILSLFNEARCDYNQDRRTMLTCLDMISKMSGYYSPETSVNIQNNLDSIKIEIIQQGDKNNNTSE